MTIEPPDPGIRFETGLARQQGWTGRFADRVTDEYRRFLYLAATAGFEVTPSLAVDEAWHLHLRLPHYREVLCGRILGRPLDHLPGTGTAEDDARCAGQYEETLALYERVFGKPAPRDIWPRPAGAGEIGYEKGRWPVRTVGLTAAAAGLIAGLVAEALGAPALAAVLLIGSFFLGLVCFPFQAMVGVMRRQNGSAGCGGSGGGGDGGSGCCASCGGSCGGGGCGGGD